MLKRNALIIFSPWETTAGSLSVGAWPALRKGSHLFKWWTSHHFALSICWSFAQSYLKTCLHHPQNAKPFCEWQSSSIRRIVLYNVITCRRYLARLNFVLCYTWPFPYSVLHIPIALQRCKEEIYNRNNTFESQVFWFVKDVVEKRKGFWKLKV